MKKIIILIVILFISIHIFAEEGKVDFLSNSSVVIIDTKINSTTVNIITNREFAEKEKNNKDFYKAEEYFKNGDYIKAKELYKKLIDMFKERKIKNLILERIKDIEYLMDKNSINNYCFNKKGNIIHVKNINNKLYIVMDAEDDDLKNNEIINKTLLKYYFENGIMIDIREPSKNYETILKNKKPGMRNEKK
jgi:hypothetical protein